MIEFGRRLHDALRVERPTESVQAIKDVVSDELNQFDRRATVHRTEYFNHSFVPDFVLSWVDAQSQRQTRAVYLRFQTRRLDLLDEVRLLSDQSPIVFGIGDVFETDGDADARIDEMARDTNSLVTDTDGVETVVQARESSAFVRVVSTALGIAGRGLLGQPEARSLTNVLNTGFDGAQQLNVETAVAARDAIREVLSSEAAGQFIGFLRAVWLGNGGDPDVFPAPATGAMQLPDEALQLLLTMDEIPDPAFWWQVGAKMSLDQLGRMTLESMSNNLQQLVRAAHPVLTAKLCRILQDQPRLDTQLPEMYWVIERGLLALRGRDFTAYLAPRQEPMSIGIGERRVGVPLQTLRDRTDAHHVAVGGFELAREDRNVTYGSDTEADVIHDDEVAILADALGPTAFVQHAEARLPDGKVLQLDFQTLTASGRTTAQFPLREILIPSVALMWTMAVDDRVRLEELLPSVADPSGQATLDVG